MISIVLFMTAHSLTHSPTHSLTHLTHSPHSLTHLTHSLTHSPHSLTHSSTNVFCFISFRSFNHSNSHTQYHGHRACFVVISHLIYVIHGSCNVSIDQYRMVSKSFFAYCEGDTSACSCPELSVSSSDISIVRGLNWVVSIS